MTSILLYIFYIVIIVSIYEIIHGIIRQRNRCKLYKLAEQQSRNVKKKLLVVGDPYSGHGTKFYSLFMDNYGCGDITVDLTGAPMCPTSYKVDILTYLRDQPDNSLVIFISCVLEYVDDIDAVISEIYRVAGSVDNIFITTVNKYSLSAYFYNDKYSKSKYIIYAPPEYNSIRYVRI